MANGYIKFNAWCKDLPFTNENMKIFVNAGNHYLKQKFNSYLVNPTPLNKFGKLPDNATLSKGVSNAISAFFEQVKPDFEVDSASLKEHTEPFTTTWLGDFCITDIAEVKGVKVGADGLWLIKECDDGIARIWNCDNFHKIEI